MYARFVKRGIDILISGCALILLSPLFLIIVAAIKVDSPGPILFKQRRIGMNKKFFNIVKFRTMKTFTPRDVPTHLLQKPEQYITNVGKFLRKTSLDELPQLMQIFTGKMAIVGPRPALWNQHDLIGAREKFGVNDIRPGLTGWAQINGRDTISVLEKARLDAEYANKLSFQLDFYCFLLTVKKVVKGEGIAEGETESKKQLQGALK